MSYTARIQYIIKALIKKDGITLKQIADEFEISTRQASRDIEQLRYQMGAPIEYDKRDKVYRLTQDWSSYTNLDDNMVILAAYFRSLIEQLPLKKSIKKHEHVIKRETFMKDDSLNKNYAFFKNALGDTELLNINDKKLTLITGGKNYSLEPGTSFYIVNHDTIQMGNDVIHIKDKPKHDLTTMSKVFAKTFDYTKEVQEELAKLNQKTIAKRIQQSTKPIGKMMFNKIGGQDKAIEELKKSILFHLFLMEMFL